MNGLFSWLTEVQTQSPHMLKALLAGTLVSTVCGVVGCFIVLRRSAFLADALAHAMLAGVVCGYLVMKLMFGLEAHAPAMLIGSVIAGLVTVGLVGFVSRFSRIKEDTVIGIMYTAVFAAGGVILSLNSHHVPIDLGHFLTGQLLAVQNGDLWMMAIVSSAVLAAIILLFRPLQLVSFDPVMAASLGLPVVALDYLLTGCTSLVVVAGVNIVGVILVVGMLIIPAGSAYLLCDRLRTMLWVSALLGWTSFIAGYAWSEWINVAPGSAVVVAGALQFFVILVVAPRYGLLADWTRRWQAVPQQMIEDVLGERFAKRRAASYRQFGHASRGGQAAVSAAGDSTARQTRLARARRPSLDVDRSRPRRGGAAASRPPALGDLLGPCRLAARTPSRAGAHTRARARSDHHGVSG